MTTRAAVVTEARTWIGTRFHHQAALKGVGCDCVGLVMGVGIALGLLPADFATRPEFEPFRGYSRVPAGDALLEHAFSLFTIPLQRGEAAGPGDVLLFRFQGDPCHVAILGDYPGGGLSLIHAYAPLRRVIETRMDATWEARVTASYRLPGVEA